MADPGSDRVPFPKGSSHPQDEAMAAEGVFEEEDEDEDDAFALPKLPQDLVGTATNIGFEDRAETFSEPGSDTKEEAAERLESLSDLALNGRKSMVTNKIGPVSVPDVLVELYDLTTKENGDMQSWQETARWIKYEEDVEGLDRRWGKPHVAFLTFHSLIQVRKCLSKGLILLDAEGNSFEDLCNLITAAMKSQYDMDEVRTSAIFRSLNRKHSRVLESSILPNLNPFRHVSLAHQQISEEKNSIRMDPPGQRLPSTTLEMESPRNVIDANT